METIEIKQANVDALRAMLEQIQQLDHQYRGAVNALAIANDVPPTWQWDGKSMRFIAPPAPPSNGNGNGDKPPDVEGVNDE